MPTRRVTPTPEQDAVIDELLKRRRAKESFKLDRLRLTIQQVVAALDSGDYTVVEDEELDELLEELVTPR